VAVAQPGGALSEGQESARRHGAATRGDDLDRGLANKSLLAPSSSKLSCWFLPVASRVGENRGTQGPCDASAGQE
jgi:hypothetical protein